MSQGNVKSAPRSEIIPDVHSGWTEAVSPWLIQHAACRAPESLSRRLEEEWLADLAARPSPMSRLRFAIGCCWATQVIAHEHYAVSVPATTSMLGAKPMIAYAQNTFGFFSRRTPAV